MKQVLAIAASNKKMSINKMLLLFAAGKLQRVRVNVLSLSEIQLPLYNEEIEQETGIPDTAQAIYRSIKQADGFIIACPEHNGLPPVSFKNLFDWLSRIDQLVFQYKPVLLLSASPGMKGGASNLMLLETLLPRWGGEPAGLFSLGDFYNNFNTADLKINDSSLDAKLTTEVNMFNKTVLQNQGTVLVPAMETRRI